MKQQQLDSQTNRRVRELTHIRAAIYGQPLAISEPGLDLICGILEARAEGIMPEFVMQNGDDDSSDEIQHLEMIGDIAKISVMGPIFPRANLFTMLSNMTSAQGVMKAIDAAKAKDPSAYVFFFDSPGGAISLGFETADKIHELAQGSAPVCAVVQGSCASLAYLWASQCDKIYAGVDSMVGSVSVVMRMTSSDRAMKNQGIDTVTMKSGALKQMDDPATLAFASQYQALLDQLSHWHEMFVDHVQRGRAGLDVKSIANGNVWFGKKAVEAGLADEISTLEKVLAELS